MIWIGLYNVFDASTNQTTWHWTDGTVVSYMKWGPLDPNAPLGLPAAARLLKILDEFYWMDRLTQIIFSSVCMKVNPNFLSNAVYIGK